jgi:hypothetical protein
VEYQQGELAGYEVREYLLEKFHRQCIYCKIADVPLEVEHITPKSRGGSNRISNLTLACNKCNNKKNTMTAAEFGYPKVQALAKVPLKDAMAVNTTRWELYHRLQQTGLPVETGTGGTTKFNRTQRGLTKTHWLDAACVGKSTPGTLIIKDIKPLLIKATGHGSRQMCLVDQYGFPRSKAKTSKKAFGFQTGDLIKAIVTNGSKQGTYTGRVAIRATGYFNIRTKTTFGKDIHHRFCKLIYHTDGYTYNN